MSLLQKYKEIMSDLDPIQAHVILIQNPSKKMFEEIVV